MHGPQLGTCAGAAAGCGGPQATTGDVSVAGLIVLIGAASVGLAGGSGVWLNGTRCSEVGPRLRGRWRDRSRG